METLTINTASRLSGVGEYYFSKKLREIEFLNAKGHQIINLGIGSPDLPPHSTVIEALQTNSNLPNVHAYQSYKGSLVLREAIKSWYAKWYQVTLDAQTEVLPLMGSKEGIMHICMTYFEQGNIVLVPNPGYPTYSSAVILSGATPYYYSLNEANNYEPDFNQLAQVVNQYKQNGQLVKGMFVNYPHMPTGTNGNRVLFEKLVQFALKYQLLLIHDNPYSFVLNDAPMSILSVPRAKEVAIELNSLSKSHSMAGWRIGMLCGAAARIEEVLRFKSNMDSGMFLPAQLAAAQALSLSSDYHDTINAIYKRRRLKAFELLNLLNCSYNQHQVGMFVWAKVSLAVEEKSKLALANNAGEYLSDGILNNAYVFITPGFIFGSAGNNYVRVSLCSTEDVLQNAIERIKKIKQDVE